MAAQIRLKWLARAALAVAVLATIAACFSFNWYPACNEEFASSSSGETFAVAAISAAIALFAAAFARRPLAAITAVLLIGACALLYIGWGFSGMRDAC